MAGKVKGLKTAIDKTRKFQQKVEMDKRRGLTKIGLFVKGAAQKNVPVDTGNLRSSAFSKLSSSMKEVVIGFTAKYAIWVHENLEQKLKGQPRADFGTTKDGVSFGGGTGKGSYWDSGGPKFLERAINDNEATIEKILVNEVRV